MDWYGAPGTTDIKGAAFGNPTVAEAGNRLGEANVRAEAQNAGDILAASSRGEVAARTADDIRGTGTLTKFRPIGGWQEGRGGPAAPGGGGAPGGRLAAATEFGEPTSYNGGVGAPAPVQVIKGMRTSYVNPTPDNGMGGFTPTPGTGPREFTTPLQAGQAFNQANRKGDFNPPGTEIARITAGLTGLPEEREAKAKLFGLDTQLKQNELDKQTREANLSEFNKKWQGLYVQTDKTGAIVKPTDPNVIQDMSRAAEVARTKGPEAGLKHYQESLQVRQHEPLFTDQNLTAHKTGFTMDELNNLRQQNPDLYRRTVLTIGPKLQQAGARPPLPWYRSNPSPSAPRTSTSESDFVAP